MKLLTRAFCATGLALLASVVTLNASAQAPYPSQAITMVVPQAPGGTNDIVARLIAAELAQELKQSVVVTNRPGAGGNIGTEQVKRATPDGYTILMTVNSAQAINPALYKSVGFDPVKDFTPITTIGSVPNVLLVHPTFPAKTLDEFIALIKANPGKYQYASAGNGTVNHLLGAMLDQMAGLKMEHIPYKGVGPAMVDVLGGQVPIVFASLPSALSNIREGKLRALAVSTEKRSPALPDVPAIAERIPGFSGELWIALFGVAGTPPEIIDTLYRTTARVMQKPSTQQKLADQGVELAFDTPDQLRDRLAGELVKWRKIVEASGARVD
jgi:tripartite-type tricarboxylate transporter receptor subunit TctC